MKYSYNDEFRKISRDEILDTSETDELYEFLIEKVNNPFASASDYFKKLKKKKDSEEMLSLCIQILNEIKDTYNDKIDFNFTEESDDLIINTHNIYLFFIHNIKKNMYIFLREFLFSNKNRKKLINGYKDIKLETYPKEQYGNKDNYILIIKLSSIIKDIRNLELSLSEFISYLNRANDSAVYINLIEGLIDSELLIDKNIVKSLFDEFLESDVYNKILNKLKESLNTGLILPILKDTGLLNDKISFVQPEEDDILTSNENEDEETEEY